MTDTGTATEKTDDADKAQSEVEKWKAMARKHEQAAKANADAAERLAKLEAANQSDLERLTNEATAAKDEAAKAKADSLRWRIAAKHQISDEDAELFLLGTDEATLTKQAERLAGRQQEQKKNGPVVPKEGSTTTVPEGADTKEFARSLFQNS
jgi:hypothetical protein